MCGLAYRRLSLIVGRCYLRSVQAFAISTKGRVRPGRFRRDPNDVTACRYDMRPKLLKVSRLSAGSPCSVVHQAWSYAQLPLDAACWKAGFPAGGV